MGTHPIFESDFDCLTDSKRTLWRTQLQPRHPVVVSEVVSVVVAEDAVEAVDEVEASPSQRNGNPLPSSVDLSRTARSSPLKKSTASPFQSRSSGSSITSSAPPSRTKSCRSS